jgi:hypothetical protein
MCTGTFAGAYQWQCNTGKIAADNGIGLLRLFPDGHVRLMMLEDPSELIGQVVSVQPTSGGEYVGQVWADRRGEFGRAAGAQTERLGNLSLQHRRPQVRRPVHA